jgi:hypothetical protein
MRLLLAAVIVTLTVAAPGVARAGSTPTDCSGKMKATGEKASGKVAPWLRGSLPLSSTGGSISSIDALQRP